MKRLITLSVAFLSVAAFVPVVGCGGSDSADLPAPEVPAVRSAVVVSTGAGKAVRVSWQPPAGNDPATNAVVEYQIYRAPVTDDYVPPVVNGIPIVPTGESKPSVRDLPGAILVGTVDGKTTTFVDTTQERTFTVQHIASSNTGNPDRLTSSEKTAPGLTPNRYAYDVLYLYRRPPFVDNLTGEVLNLYTGGWFSNPIQPVRFE